jgi:hypothetical protein
MDIFDRLFRKRAVAAVAAAAASDSALNYPLLLARSKEELAIQTRTHDNIFQLGTAAWSADLAAGTIEFTSSNGVKATASLQIIGTFNTEDSTWLWAWANNSIPSTLCNHANALKQYGEAHGVERFITRKLQCLESEAWEFTAVANKLGSGQGAYRGPDGSAFVFMTFSNVKVQRAQ